MSGPEHRLLPIALETTTSGDARRLEAGGLSLLQYPATEVESGPAAVHLRRRTAESVVSRPLTGPASGGARTRDGAVLTEHDGLAARTRLGLGAGGEGWAWTVDLENHGPQPVELDLLHTLDVALAPQDAVRRNEQYVAQYLDLTPVELPADAGHEASTALAVRQNLPGPTTPWAAVGASVPIAQWATDALQLLDRTTGEGLDTARALPSERLQHEHTLAALRTAPIVLGPGEGWSGSFWGFAVADHPGATGPEDAALIRSQQQRLEARETLPGTWPTDGGVEALPISYLALARPVPVREASSAEIADLAGGALRQSEGTETLHSAFTDSGHLVTAAKERLVLRPHGHIQQTVASGSPDLRAVASTVWMRGVFCSQLTLGHASADALTTVRRSYLGLQRSGGVRLMLRTGKGPWSSLSLPSLWLTGEARSEWLYLTDAATIRVRSRVVLGSGAQIDIELEGGADEPGTTGSSELLLVVGAESEELALDVTVDGCGAVMADDAALFADGIARGTGLRTVALGGARLSQVRLGRRGTEPGDGHGEAQTPYSPRLPMLRGADEHPGVAAVGEMIPWLAQNASVHFRSPRGLEQYSGGAWGTRDVCQGPVGLLRVTDEPDVLRETLLTIFSAQQEDGTWPQWFDYLPGHARPDMRDAHGDVVYWPLLALGEHLAATGDDAILHEPAAWVGREAMGVPTPVLDHVSRALDHIAAQRTADPRLPAYGHGDWNDSLQPASPELAEQLCSTWTTELEIKALRVLAEALPEDTGPMRAITERCRELADGAEQALRELLLVDGELSGYAILDGQDVRLLVHPADHVTGMRHGSLQMIHALADELLEPEEAVHHLALLREHLAGPSGLFLFDRPLAYRGGEMSVFQRAEAATYWGREIGLMYMHAHLRWIEALTHLGEAELAWTELLKAVPVGLAERVPGARLRQANCYYSSADAVFPDRYVAMEHAEALFEESTGFEGGWRVYSSGPGLLLRILVEDVLGIHRRVGALVIDPVLPSALDGAVAEIPHGGGHITVRYRRGERGSGVRRLLVDGDVVVGTELNARYRPAGIAIDASLVRAGSVLEVQVG